jgi:plastin-1
MTILEIGLFITSDYLCLGSGPQVRPKMILTLTASIMLWSLANKVTKAVDSSASLGKWAGAVTKIEATNKLGNSLRTPV